MDINKITNNILSPLLKEYGFELMSKEVKKETDTERIKRYVRVVLKNTKDESKKSKLYYYFKLLSLA